MQITIAQLNAILGFNGNQYLKPLNDTFEKYSINTPLRICHFMAQVLHESGKFTHFEENLRYSANGLLNTFPKYFSIESAPLFAFKPQQIANIVYRGRMGNSDVNDGWIYRGKGAIQITGKTNSIKCMHDLGLNNVNDLLNLPNAIISAGWFWNEINGNTLSDKDDIISITKRINGGLNGISERKANLITCKKYIQ